MNDQRMVDVELLKELLAADEAENDHAYYRVLDKFRAIIDGPGVEPMVPLRIEYEPGFPEEVAFGSQMQMDRLKKWLDQLFQFILAAPSAPVQAVPDGWQLVPKEPTKTCPAGANEPCPNNP